MLSFGGRRIFLARAVVDMRKSFDSLSDLVRGQLDKDPYTGDVFVFVGKNRSRVKMLVWDASGFWVCAKRLEGGMFALPAGAQPPQSRESMPLTAAQVQMLLEGIPPSDQPPRPHYQRPALNAVR
ncbi:MAG: IS66 family insertion sequence element accessory protein TnpB [Planctomycetes bacterium]|nr:IS66 family insertion sequence element accessory protein TnpB [Planctomycetota bacterium]